MQGRVSFENGRSRAKWWGDIIKELESRNVDRWLEAAVILLNFPVDEQYQVERAFKRVKKNVRKNWLRRGTVNTVVMCAPRWKSDAVVLLAFRERQKRTRHHLMEDIASRVFTENTHVKKCLVLGINIDRSRYPYNLLAVFHPHIAANQHA